MWRIECKYATYEYWDSNGWCKFTDTSTYKITGDHSVAVTQTKNDDLSLYLALMKMKRNFFIWNG